MQLEAGKKYTDRRGRVYGPLVHIGNNIYGESRGESGWYGDGSRDGIRTYSADVDLVAEYVEPVQAESWYRHRDCRLIVLRVADGRVTYFEDGIQGGSYCEKERAYILGEKITAEEAASLIRHKVEPAPVESPDDWVTQDRVPARADVDQELWSNWLDGRWRVVRPGVLCASRKMIHGEIDHVGDTLSLRCRRKDLPPVPPKTRTVVLKEWLCWDDCEPEAVTVDWFSLDPSEDHGQFLAYDHAVETGNTRTVEIPVT